MNAQLLQKMRVTLLPDAALLTYSLAGPAMVTSFSGTRTFELYGAPLVCLQSSQWHAIWLFGFALMAVSMLRVAGAACCQQWERRNRLDGDLLTVVWPQRHLPVSVILRSIGFRTGVKEKGEVTTDRKLDL